MQKLHSKGAEITLQRKGEKALITQKQLNEQMEMLNRCWKWYKYWSTHPVDYMRAIRESDFILELYEQNQLCMDMMYVLQKQLSKNIGQDEDLPEDWRKDKQ